MKLKDKVCIITGGAQGIGEAYARRFAKEGGRVVVADVNVEKGTAVAKEVGGVFERVDVSSEADTQRLAGAVAERLGRIDVLVNNAAIFYGIDNTNTTYEYLRKIFDVNYFGAWLMSRAVFPHMRDGGGGSIINQSSSAAYMHPEYPIDGDLPSFHYSVTKAAMNAMTHYMAGSCGRFGIRVNAIAPGPTMTEATKQGVPEHIMEMIINFQMAIHRALEPDDLTGTAVWLASDDSKMVTGQVIPVDGGMIMLG
jgi:3-oxoacyl-[acyl-carrier protein] reductase